MQRGKWPSRRATWKRNKIRWPQVRKGFPGGSGDKESACQCRRPTRLQSLGGEDPLEKEMTTHSSILAWRSPHGQWVLAGYNLQGHKETLLAIWHALGVGASLEAQMVKNLPAMQETQLWSHGREDPLEKEMATHSSFLAWRIHGQRSLGGDTVHGVAKSQTWPSDWCTHRWGKSWLCVMCVRREYIQQVNLPEASINLLKINDLNVAHISEAFSWKDTFSYFILHTSFKKSLKILHRTYWLIQSPLPSTCIPISVGNNLSL